MKKNNNYILSVLLLFAILFSCQKQDVANSDEQSAAVKGLFTRSSSVGLPPTMAYNLGVVAMLNSVPYLMNVPATMASGSGVITFNNGPWFYPLNKDTLDFYAYSIPVSSTSMVITSGSVSANDAILSNNGGTGTPGSSQSQVTQLLFSHIMTKVDVIVRVTDPKLVAWVPTTFRFGLNGVVGSGKYSILSAPGAVATNISGTYNLVLGTNYLVPTGGTLNGNLTSLVIDNYTATASDLLSLVITGTPGVPNITLNPGSAYTITLTINSLKLQGITVALGSWNKVVLTNDAVTYVPQTLNLNKGAYVGTDITEIEVIDNSDRIFSGSVTGSTVSFLLAPTTAKAVNIYTATGLLLTLNNPSFTGTTIDLGKINKYGMLPNNPTLDYNATTNPYVVTTVEQFKRIDASTSYNYIQQKNLDFNMQLLPSINMNGSYNGNGYQLSNVNFINTGLFSAVAVGQVVRNVWISSGVICYGSNGAVLGSICGTNNGTIVACVNGATISATGANLVGGICGSNAGQVIASLNIGNIKVNTALSVGGICGENSFIGNPAVLASLNVGMITGTITNLAGICGHSVTGATFANSYWLTGTAASTIGGAQVAVNGTGLTTTDLADLSQQWIRGTQTLSNLNGAIPVLWNIYSFTMNNSVWPMPKLI